MSADIDSLAECEHLCLVDSTCRSYSWYTYPGNSYCRTFAAPVQELAGITLTPSTGAIRYRNIADCGRLASDVDTLKPICGYEPQASRATARLLEKVPGETLEQCYQRCQQASDCQSYGVTANNAFCYTWLDRAVVGVVTSGQDWNGGNPLFYRYYDKSCTTPIFPTYE